MQRNVVLESPGYDKKLTVSQDFGHLVIWNENVTDQDIETLIIPRLQKNPSIQSLTISGERNQFGHQGVKAIADNLQLDHLHLTDRLTSYDLKILLGNKYFRALTLINNQFEDDENVEGIRDAVIANTRLQELNCWLNRIGDKIAKALAASESIQRLHLSYNQMGGDGMKALAANTHFESLIVDEENYDSKDTKARDAILCERDPHKRALYGLEAGVTGEVPSLKRLCLFKVQQHPVLDRERLPSDLREQLKRSRV